MDMMVWLLKVNIANIFLYAFYKLFFQKDTFFNAKRVILLSSIVFSLFYPFFDVKEIFLSKTTYLEENLLAFELPEFLVLSGAEKAPQTMSLMNIAGIIWITGIISLFSYFVFQIISILSKILVSKPVQLLGIKVYVLKGLKTPFSFFNYILINPDFHDEQELSEILHHEKTHVREKHTYDVILSELFCILCWFNPFVWLIKKEIRINLEFLADNFVMKSVKNTEHYQLHLLRLSYHKAIAQLSNNFNVSPLKKRIQMMNKKKSSSAGIIKYILFVPLFAALLLVNNLRAQDDKEKIQSLDELIVVAYEVAGSDNDGKQEQKPQPKVQKQKPQPPIVFTPDGKEVFKYVEQMPQYPGGEKQMMKYLSQNIKYPVEAQKQGIQGTVVCRFIVSLTGEVTDVTILKSLTTEIDEEAIRVVSGMPNWTPGKQGGKEVSVYYTLPIRFRLTPQGKNAKASEIPAGVDYIVDGKIVSKEEANKISPEKIESVDVLKDESAPGGKIMVTLKE